MPRIKGVEPVRKDDDPIAFTNLHYVMQDARDRARRSSPVTTGTPGRDRTREMRVLRRIEKGLDPYG